MSKSHLPSLAIVNLGCPKNQVEAEKMAASFHAAGCRYTQDSLNSDIVLINTCGFIESAKTESIDTILSYLELKKDRPGLKVVVAGCLYERYKKELSCEFAEVDGWLALPVPAMVKKLVRDLGFRAARAAPTPQYGRPVLLNEPGVAYLKISEGCDRPCGFCAIPAIKGRMVSRPAAELAEEARILATEHGVREINLIAQDPAAYGRDLGAGSDLLALVRTMAAVREVAWFRLLYMFPFGLSEELLDFLASEPRFCAYLDMPLQHAHRYVLARMRRPGDGPRYLDYLDLVRHRWPGVALRSTFLVGHPGETEEHFEALCDFARRARLQWFGVFEFSPEEGTFSVEQEGAVDPAAVADRAARLREVLEESRGMEPFALGKVRPALVVERTLDYLACRTETEAPEVDGVVYVPARPGAAPGELIEIRVDEADGFDFRGEIVESERRSASCAEVRASP